jgi:RHS repeat-associated protein
VDQYQYDALGNLVHVTTRNETAIDYLVDAMSRRIVKKKSGTIVARYIYRNGLSPVAVLNASGALLARFVYATRSNTPDFMVLANGSIYTFLNDERGSPRVLANVTTGAIVQILQYDEFGNRTVFSNTGEIPAEAQPFGFAGGLFDADTGLVRFGARDYEPETGRWLAKDPALFGGEQTNFYVYAGNDPVNRVDPSGRDGIVFGFTADFGAVSQFNYTTGVIDAGSSSGGIGFTQTSFNVGPGGSTGLGGQIGYFAGTPADFAGSTTLHLGLPVAGALNFLFKKGEWLPSGATYGNGFGFDLGLLWSTISKTSFSPRVCSVGVASKSSGHVSPGSPLASSSSMGAEGAPNQP